MQQRRPSTIKKKKKTKGKKSKHYTRGKTMKDEGSFFPLIFLFLKCFICPRELLLPLKFSNLLWVIWD